MAISKIIYKESANATPEVWMDATSATAAAADITAPKTAMLANGVVTTGTGSGGGGGGGYFAVAYLTDTITNRTIQVGSGSRQNMANGGKYSFNSGDTIIIRLVDGGEIYRNGQRAQTTGSSTMTYTFTAPSAYLAIECISDKIYICDIEVE